MINQQTVQLHVDDEDDDEQIHQINLIRQVKAYFIAHRTYSHLDLF